MATENEIIEILAERFGLTFEQAQKLVICHKMSGSCDEGIMGTVQATGIGLEIVQQVFYSLDDLAAIIKTDQDMKKWWKTGEM